MPSTRHGHHNDTLFKTCNKKYYFTVEKNLKTPPGKPLVVGLAVHQGLAVRHSSRPTPDRDTKSLIAVQDYLDNLPDLVRSLDHFEDSCHQSLLLMRKYLDHYRLPDEWRYISDELPFDLEVDSVRITGRIDGVILWNNMVLVLEHKTTADPPMTYADKHKLNLQTLRYCVAASALLDRPVVGALINIIGKPREGSTKVTFHRDLITHTLDEQKQFIKDLKLTRLQQDLCRTSNTWPQNDESCFNWFRKCEFYDLCRFGETQAMLQEYTDYELLEY